MSGLAPLPSRVGPVLQYLRDRRTPFEGNQSPWTLTNGGYNTLFNVKRGPAVSYLVLEYIENHFFFIWKKEETLYKIYNN